MTGLPIDGMAGAVRTGALFIREGWGNYLRETEEEAIASGETSVAYKIALFMPIKWGDQVVGAIATGSKPEQRSETIYRLHYLEPLLSELALVIRMRGQSSLEMEQLPTPALIVQNKRIVSSNQKIAQLFGHLPQTLLHTSFEALLHPQHRVPMIDRITQNQTTEATKTIGLRVDGTILPLYMWSQQIQWYGEPAWLVCAMDGLQEQLVVSRERIARSLADSRRHADLTDTAGIIQAELAALGTTCQAVSIGLIDAASLTIRYWGWLIERGPYDDIDDLPNTFHDADQLRLHWRRGEVYDRTTNTYIVDRLQQRSTPHYAPHRLIDVPFKQGMLGVGLKDPHQFEGLIPFLKEIAQQIENRLDSLESA